MDSLWRHVDNEKPEIEVPIIGYDLFYGRVGEAKLDKYSKVIVFIDSDDCHIEWWQPMPEPPKEARDE